MTMLDILKINGSDATVGLIEAEIVNAPEFRLGSARSIAGTFYKTLLRTSVGSAGFRGANEGNAARASSYENKLVETYIADCAAEVDEAVAMANEDGVAGTIALEQSANIEAQLRAMGSQFYYGGDNGFATSIALKTAKGFNGLASAVNSSLVLDAAGTTGSTGSSVFGVGFGAKKVQWVLGQGGNIDDRDAYRSRLTDANGNPFDGIRAPLLFWIGLQIVNPNSFGQIKNLTADSGKGLDDDKLAEFMAKFAVGMKPDVLMATSRSITQLQQSRTATNPSGQPVPRPTDYLGTPLVETDSIVDTENIV